MATLTPDGSAGLGQHEEEMVDGEWNPIFEFVNEKS